jgi:tetratricopeptide (TPR) repeat protein
MQVKLIKLSGSILILVLTFVIASCTKEVPKEFAIDNPQNTVDQQEMPDDEIHRNMRQGFDHALDSDMGSNADEEKANQMMKEADLAEAKYQKSKSETDKKEAINLNLATANFMMLEANLSSKIKYRGAYKRYKKVLDLDPQNEEAAQNKQLIEDIYNQMGMDVPSEE